MWQYLSPYAESMEGDSKTLSRLQGKSTSCAAPPCASVHTLPSQGTAFALVALYWFWRVG